MRNCLHRNKTFSPKSPHHMFCKVSHREAYNKGKSWESYFKSLIRNNSKERKKIDAKYLMRLYRKQKAYANYLKWNSRKSLVKEQLQQTHQLTELSQNGVMLKGILGSYAALLIVFVVMLLIKSSNGG